MRIGAGCRMMSPRSLLPWVTIAFYAVPLQGALRQRQAEVRWLADALSQSHIANVSPTPDVGTAALPLTNKRWFIAVVERCVDADLAAQCDDLKIRMIFKKRIVRAGGQWGLARARRAHRGGRALRVRPAIVGVRPLGNDYRTPRFFAFHPVHRIRVIWMGEGQTDVPLHRLKSESFQSSWQTCFHPLSLWTRIKVRSSSGSYASTSPESYLGEEGLYAQRVALMITRCTEAL